MDIEKDYNNYYYNWDNYNGLDIHNFVNRKTRKIEIKKIRKQLNKIKKQDKKHYLMNIDYMLNEKKNNIGIQLKQESNENFDGLGGFCVGWSLYMIFLTFININLNIACFIFSFLKSNSSSFSRDHQLYSASCPYAKIKISKELSRVASCAC